MLHFTVISDQTEYWYSQHATAKCWNKFAFSEYTISIDAFKYGSSYDCRNHRKMHEVSMNIRVCVATSECQLTIYALFNMLNDKRATYFLTMTQIWPQCVFLSPIFITIFKHPKLRQCHKHVKVICITEYASNQNTQIITIYTHIIQNTKQRLSFVFWDRLIEILAVNTHKQSSCLFWVNVYWSFNDLLVGWSLIHEHTNTK